LVGVEGRSSRPGRLLMSAFGTSRKLATVPFWCARCSAVHVRGPGWRLGTLVCPGECAVDVDGWPVPVAAFVDADEVRPAAKRWCGADGCRLGRGSGIRIRQDEFPLVGAGGVFQLESAGRLPASWLDDGTVAGGVGEPRPGGGRLKDWLVVRTGPLVFRVRRWPRRRPGPWPRAGSARSRWVPVADRGGRLGASPAFVEHVRAGGVWTRVSRGDSGWWPRRPAARCSAGRGRRDASAASPAAVRLTFVTDRRAGMEAFAGHRCLVNPDGGGVPRRCRNRGGEDQGYISLGALDSQSLTMVRLVSTAAVAGVVDGVCRVAPSPVCNRRKGGQPDDDDRDVALLQVRSTGR